MDYQKILLITIFFHVCDGGIRQSKSTEIISIARVKNKSENAKIRRNSFDYKSEPHFHGNYRRLPKSKARVATIHPRVTIETAVYTDPDIIVPLERIQQRSPKRCIAQVTVLEFMRQENARTRKRIVRY